MTVMEKLSPPAAREVAAACERLCLDYAHFADAGRMDAWAGLFAEDGELVLFGQTHKGRAAIHAAVGAGAGGTLHVTSNICIDVLSEDVAEGTAYVVAYVKAQPASTPLTPMAIGVYRDRYRRAADGWRFARREFESFLVAGG